LVIVFVKTNKPYKILLQTMLYFQICAANLLLYTIPVDQSAPATRARTARACYLATDAWNSVAVPIIFS
jgi:hypothetical protein